MSSVKAWLTEEEVLKDLAKVSGRRVTRAGELDKSYLVVGNAPPPIMKDMEAEDDEMLQLFGDVKHERGVSCELAPPDLQGITNLIRMVQESDPESDDEDLKMTDSNCVIAISKGTKLNPNVKEFVPRGDLSSPNSSDASVTTPSGNLKTENDQAKDIRNKTNARFVTSNDLNIDEDLVTKLKNKISTADSFESKRQNNVAIASLLQLYATGNNKTSNTKDESRPVKLITPDFYESKASPTKEVETVSSVDIVQSTSTTPLPKSTTSTLSISSNEAKSEPISSKQGVASKPAKVKIDPAVKKSIEKVNQWLGEPVQKKAPAVYFGPISFKKKEPTLTKSPSVSDTEQRQEPKPTQPTQPNQYRPSNYASDLGKKYMERSKKKQTQKFNSWTDLDVILKQKDEMMLKKLTQASENVSNAPQRI